MLIGHAYICIHVMPKLSPKAVQTPAALAGLPAKIPSRQKVYTGSETVSTAS